jgi:hypothetical protein
MSKVSAYLILAAQCTSSESRPISQSFNESDPNGPARLPTRPALAMKSIPIVLKPRKQPTYRDLENGRKNLRVAHDAPGILSRQACHQNRKTLEANREKALR